MNRILMRALIGVAGLGAAGTTVAAVNGVVLDEQRLAMQEEGRMIRSPIAGIVNHYWYDYRTNVGEAQKELSNDLRGASDTEDRRDAWDEYAHELRHERVHYVKEMAERGHRYRYGTVHVEDQ